MICISWVGILGDHKFKENFENFVVELCRVKNCISGWQTNLLRDPLPPAPNSQMTRKPRECGLKILYIRWMVIVVLTI